MVARVRKPNKLDKMDQGARRWLYGYVKKNFWRYPDWMEFEDLIDYGVECYYVVRRKYPTAVDRPHIMRLFMLVVHSRFTNLSVRKKGVDATDFESWRQNVRDSYGVHRTVYDLPAESPIERALDAVPNRFRSLLIRLIEDGYVADPKNLPPVTKGLWFWEPAPRDQSSKLAMPLQRQAHHRETFNERLCQLGGFDPERINLADILRMFLTTPTNSRQMIKSRPVTGKIREQLERLGCTPEQIESHIRQLRSAPRMRGV